jgi:hypothetical protein
MVNGSRLVGTDGQERLISELLSYLRPTSTPAQRALPFNDARLNKKVKSEPCCYVNPLGTRCSNPRNPNGMFCAGHTRQCSRVLHNYQETCLKQSPVQANQLYESAKLLIKMFYANRRREDVITDLMNRSIVSHSNTINLEHLEDVKVHLENVYENDLGEAGRQRAQDIVQQNYDHWKNCWFGRRSYRAQCEQCHRDDGHNAVYYVFKIATMIGTVIRHME